MAKPTENQTVPLAAAYIMAGGCRRRQHLNQLEQDEYRNGLCLPRWAEENGARIQRLGRIRGVSGRGRFARNAILRTHHLRAFQIAIIRRIAHHVHALRWSDTPRRRLDILPRLGDAFLCSLNLWRIIPSPSCRISSDMAMSARPSVNWGSR
jgi:hypothetical protein